MRRSLLIFVVVLVIGVIAGVTMRTTVFVISSGGQVDHRYLYKEDERFSVRWRHSVEKQEWEEMFRLKDETIQLTGTRFQTFGAGVPNDTGDRTFIKDGWVYMTGIDQNIGPSLSLRTGEKTNHRIQFGGRQLTLEANRAYKLSVVRQSWLSVIFEKLR
ncbi:DUF1850 domain-containing protein [Halobacillus litoralis]|uniref:DUF1850 domain-containing protein n=1 Tax=Halobacillus litoralis TaxID=45668 RepID=UPI001CD656E2|nr:DUF1850 domain-containing protein [Halobacillus litoralis]MCA0971385.1 DUF1850 domain-containing protein [Halobacillus litoralis]